jgi:hypothetical protein
MRPFRWFHLKEILAVLFILHSLPFAQKPVSQKTKLAVMELGGSALTLSERQILAETIRELAFKSVPNSWSILTRENIEALVEDKEALKDCGEECAVMTGRKLSVDYIVTGNIGKIGSYLQISVSLYDIKHGDLKGSEKVRAKSIDELMDPLDELGAKLFSKLPGAISGSKTRAQLTESREEDKADGSLQLSGDKLFIFEVNSEPADAVVEMDGSLFCQKTPCKKVIQEGSHTLRMRRDQYLDTTFDIVVSENGQKRLVDLRPNFATLLVETSVAGIAVKINGREIGRTPLEEIKVESGPVLLELHSECYHAIRQTLKLKIGEKRKIKETMSSRDAGLQIFTIDGIGGDDVLAKILVNNQQIGETPFQGKLNICVDKVEVRSEGYQNGTFPLSLKEGKITSLEVKLDKNNWPTAEVTTRQFGSKKKALLSTTGKITINSTVVGAMVMVDGVLVPGTTPLTIDSMPIGKHLIFVLTEFLRGSQTISINSNDSLNINIPMEKGRGNLKITTTPSDAIVSVKGLVIGNTPIKLENVIAGTTMVHIKKKGFKALDTLLNIYQNKDNVFGFILLPSAQILFDIVPENATISINGAPALVFDAESQMRLVEVEPGPINCKITSPDFEDSNIIDTAILGKSINMKARLKSKFASIEINSSTVTASVYLDNKRLGITPYSSDRISVGTHQLGIATLGYDRFDTTLTVAPGAAYTIFATLFHSQVYLDSVRLAKQRFAKRNQWIRRIGFGALMSGCVGAAIHFNSTEAEALKNYQAYTGTVASTHEANWEKIQSEKTTKTIFWYLSAAFGLGLAVSIPF